MKKSIAIILCLACIMSFASLTACTKKNDNLETTVKRTAAVSKDDVKKFVEQGKIDTVEFALGTNANDIVAKYGATQAQPQTGEVTTTAASQEEIFYNPPQEKRNTPYTQICYGTAQYFYLSESKVPTVAIIACTGDAYNFKAGTCLSDDVIFALGEPDSKDTPATSELLYAWGGGQPNQTRFTYKFGKFRLDFIFNDDILTATMLVDTSIITDFGHSATTAATTSAETTAES